MNEFVIRADTDRRASIVHRRSDLSGTTYERVSPIDAAFAGEVAANGVALWSQDSAAHAGRPGLILHEADDSVIVETRRDCADASSMVATTTMETLDARSCVRPGDANRIHWLIPPPA